MLPEVIPSKHERMVYHVASRTKVGRRYRVDLVANQGAGECHCKDWSVRRLANIRMGRPMGTRETMCGHVERARLFFLNQLLAELAKQEHPAHHQ